MNFCTLHQIGEDVSERLDVVPTTFRMLVTRRPRYGCRSCESAVVQAPVPARIVEGGIPINAFADGHSFDWIPLQRQVIDAKHAADVELVLRAFGHANVVEAREEYLEDDLDLALCQPHPEAGMGTGTERNVSRLAVNINDVGIFEGLRITRS